MFESIVREGKKKCCIDEPGYPIRSTIISALNTSGQRREVLQASQEIIERGGNLDFFTSTMLLRIWEDNQVAPATKIMATLWWGKVSHYNFTTVFSNGGVDRIVNNAPRIINRLSRLSEEQDFVRFKEGLLTLFRQLLFDDNYRIKGINVSFFTKFFHFWFQSHPVQSREGFLPIICDKWLRRAVYAEMVETCNPLRAHLFKVKEDTVDLRSPYAESYWSYIEYFNERARQLSVSPFRLEQLLFSQCIRNKVLAVISSEKQAVFLPDWVSGRYEKEDGIAVLFNCLTGESYLFEDDSAHVIGKVLSYRYWESIFPESFGKTMGLPDDVVDSFFQELCNELLLTHNVLTKQEIKPFREKSHHRKTAEIMQAGGVEKLPSVFESAEADYNRRIELRGVPSTVSIELTYGCNERCIHCYNPCSPRENGIVKRASKSELTFADYKTLLDDLAELGVPQVLFTGGDPFVKKDFLDILSYAREKKFAISIYTNGLYMADHPNIYARVLELYPYKVGLSIYSMDPKKHESITRIAGSLEKTKAVAKKLSRDGVALLVKCPIMKQNQTGYKRVRDFAERLGGVPEFEVNITSSVDGDTYATEKLRLSEGEMKTILSDPSMPLSPMRINPEKMKDRTPDLVFCGAGINSANITPTGDVYPCMSLPLKCGNIRKEAFSRIWKESKDFKHVRSLRYGMSDCCGKETYCKFCNRCIGQSYTEHGIPENKSMDNCFIARIREEVYKEKRIIPSP